MSVDELWSLRDEVVSVLARKISAAKARLDKKLRQLGRTVPEVVQEIGRARRPYPQVLPRYRNPTAPFETWSGRGKTPRWLTAQLRSGKKLDDFRIQLSSNHSAAPRSGRAGRTPAQTRNAILAGWPHRATSRLLAHDDAPSDAVHSRTSYSNATPSGSLATKTRRRIRTIALSGCNPNEKTAGSTDGPFVGVDALDFALGPCDAATMGTGLLLELAGARTLSIKPN